MTKVKVSSNGKWANRIIGAGEEAPDQLLANPNNFRIHPGVQQASLEGSLDTLGWIQQILVNKHTNTVIDGHLRIQLALRHHEPTVPVLYVDLTEDEERQALLSLDPVAAMAATDRDKLDTLLRSIQVDDERVQAMMREIAERERIPFGPELPEDPGAQIDRAEELREKWQVQSGQLWEVGKHRIVCGNCTDQAVVEMVMQGEKAGAVVTDPPYGINREGIENDDPEGLRELFDGCLAVMPIENAIVIAFQSPRLFPVWLDAIQAHGHKFERMLWMYKPNDETFPWRGWLQKSEAIPVSTFGNGEWLRVDPFAHDCYSPTTLGQELPKEWGKAHASVKPLAVVQDLVSRVGGIVYDPFLGSGTTLVACQRLCRLGRGIEISPAYVGVSLERLSGMGLDPKLVEAYGVDNEPA